MGSTASQHRYSENEHAEKKFHRRVPSVTSTYNANVFLLCPVCDTQLPLDSNFCYRCGEPQSEKTKVISAVPTSTPEYNTHSERRPRHRRGAQSLNSYDFKQIQRNLPLQNIENNVSKSPREKVNPTKSRRTHRRTHSTRITYQPSPRAGERKRAPTHARHFSTPNLNPSSKNLVRAAQSGFPAHKQFSRVKVHIPKHALPHSRLQYNHRKPPGFDSESRGCFGRVDDASLPMACSAAEGFEHSDPSSPWRRPEFSFDKPTRENNEASEFEESLVVSLDRESRPVPKNEKSDPAKAKTPSLKLSSPTLSLHNLALPEEHFSPQINCSNRSDASARFLFPSNNDASPKSLVCMISPKINPRKEVILGLPPRSRLNSQKEVRLGSPQQESQASKSSHEPGFQPGMQKKKRRCKLLSEESVSLSRSPVRERSAYSSRPAIFSPEGEIRNSQLKKALKSGSAYREHRRKKALSRCGLSSRLKKWSVNRAVSRGQTQI